MTVPNAFPTLFPLLTDELREFFPPFPGDFRESEADPSWFDLDPSIQIQTLDLLVDLRQIPMHGEQELLRPLHRDLTHGLQRGRTVIQSDFCVCDQFWRHSSDEESTDVAFQMLHAGLHALRHGIVIEDHIHRTRGVSLTELVDRIDVSSLGFLALVLPSTAISPTTPRSPLQIRPLERKPKG